LHRFVSRYDDPVATNDESDELTLENNPGLEHQHATSEGESMTGAGSTTQDPHGGVDDVSLDDNPGLEHDETTEAGRIMSGSGSTPADENHPR
jgi:hypothetical protein